MTFVILIVLESTLKKIATFVRFVNKQNAKTLLINALEIVCSVRMMKLVEVDQKVFVVHGRKSRVIMF